MFDLPFPIHPTTGPLSFAPPFPSVDSDPNHPFALTLSRRTPADLMSGRATPLVLARFATLAGAMQGAIDHTEGMAKGAERGRGAGRGDRGEPAARAGGPRIGLG